MSDLKKLKEAGFEVSQVGETIIIHGDHGLGKTSSPPPLLPHDFILEYNEPNLDQWRPKPRITPYRREFPKVGRNVLCPCGSGKKTKNCHA